MTSKKLPTKKKISNDIEDVSGPEWTGELKVVGQVSMLVFGDVHLYHRNTKTDHILSRLYEMIPNSCNLAKLDYIIIEGDLFDSLMQYNEPLIAKIKLWAMWLFRLCRDNNIKLRILEGTPSHDMKQCRNLVSINEGLKRPCDLKYYPELILDIDPVTGLSFIYVPDEWASPEQCYKTAKQLLEQHGLEQADFAIMHGAMDYQLPPHVPAPKHSSELWQELVAHHVFIGHIHKPSQKGKILAAGSTDRIAHGEEEAKGMLHVTCHLDKPGQSEITFVENKKAKVYKSIKFGEYEDSDDIESLLEYLSKQVEKLPEGSFVRFVSKNRVLATNAREYAKSKWHAYNFSEPKILDEDDDKPAKTSNLYDLSGSIDSAVSLTSENLVPLMKERLQSKLEGKKLDRALELLGA